MQLAHHVYTLKLLCFCLILSITEMRVGQDMDLDCNDFCGFGLYPDYQVFQNVSFRTRFGLI